MRRVAPMFPALCAILFIVATSAIRAAADEAGRGANEKAVRSALKKFDQNWQDYTNEPNFGDPRWKLKMETLVGVCRAGSVAIPFLQAAAKEDSPWAPHTRNLATELIEILRGPKEMREAVAGYDLEQIDSAKFGKQAPDFVLADVAGKTWRLSDLRGKKTVVVTFILQDI